MPSTLTGILPVLPTPFLSDGAIDISAMPALVDNAVKAGVAGVVFPGFASEVEQLTFEERHELLAAVARTVNSRVPIVAGASAETADEVIAHGRAADEIGIDWLMIQPPKSIGSDASSVIKFLSIVSRALPAAKIIVQNAPAPRGSDLSPKSILEIARAISQVTYIKEETLPSGPAISEILAGKPESLLGVIGGGGARYILDEYERGACAAMPAIEITDAHVEMDKAWRRGDKVKARNIYVRTLPLLTLQAVYRMRLTKYVMMRRGILRNVIVRAPTPELDAIVTADIDTNLVELGIIPSQPTPNGCNN